MIVSPVHTLVLLSCSQINC